MKTFFALMAFFVILITSGCSPKPERFQVIYLDLNEKETIKNAMRLSHRIFYCFVPGNTLSLICLPDVLVVHDPHSAET